MDAFDAGRYWDARLHANWTLNGVGDTRLGSSYNRWLYTLRRRVVWRELRRLDIDHARCEVLDLGSGTGFYVDLWRRLGVRSIHATDISPSAVAALGRRFPDVPCSTLDIAETWPDELGAARFDVISAFDLLFHIVDDGRYRRAFENIAAALRPGGLLVFSENFPRRRGDRGRHWVNRPLAETQRLVADMGFEIVSRAPMFVLMNSPVDPTRRLHMLAWKAATWPVARSEACGFALGALLFPFDVRLTAHVADGPSTEIMVCRKAH